MTEHLSAERVAACVCGGVTPEEQHHLRECERCGAEIARLQSALGQFRESIRGWSDSETPRAMERAGTVPRPWRFRWPALVAAALALSVVPVLKTVRDRRQAAQALADTQLLEQVDREVSEAVPTPMEPLTQLVSWGPSQNSTQSSSQ